MLKIHDQIIYFIETGLNILAVILLTLKNRFRRAGYPIRQYDTLQILGNGPSLKEDLPRVLSHRSSSALMAVNSFATTELYEQLKPEYYVIVDPAFFSTSLQAERLKTVQQSTIRAISEKTTWSLSLVVPYSAQKSACLHEMFASKPLIKLHYLPYIPVFGGSDRLNIFFFKRGLANPLFQNVLIAWLFIGLKMHYNQLIVWGADHSWHEDYRLGADNLIHTPDSHFYKEAVNRPDMILSHADGRPQQVPEAFTSIARALSIYHLLARYATAVHSHIVNLSSKTWIDAFPRKL
jgi:hypothetical protein